MMRLKAKRLLDIGLSISRFGKREFLTESYRCEDTWEKRLNSPLLRNLKMEQYFVETDKKFNMKNAVSGVDIDLFANNVQQPSQLEELEHLLFRFRKTQRSVEMMDSTTHATVRTFLKFKDYEGLFRILKNQESYGVFPDYYAYNILMDYFIKENMFKEATEVAILLMLQEDFSNHLNCLLTLYSCQMFMKNFPLESLLPPKAAEEENSANEDDEEELFERVAFLQNPFFDDHFHLTEPKHLIGKTFYLAGRTISEDPVGTTYQLYGLALYEKWDKLSEGLKNVLQGSQNHLLITEAVGEINKLVSSIEDEKIKENILNLLSELQGKDKVLDGNLEEHLKQKLAKISSLEQEDISSLKRLFQEWEEKRISALKKQNLLLDKQRRLEEIAKKREYLYWKEKLLFFFENENNVLEQYQKAQKVIAQAKEKKEEDTYVPPEITKKPSSRLTKYQKLIRIKHL